MCYLIYFSALLLAVIGMVVVVSLACLAGLVMYANYANCDPLTLTSVKSSDQVIFFNYCFFSLLFVDSILDCSIALYVNIVRTSVLAMVGDARQASPFELTNFAQS